MSSFLLDSLHVRLFAAGALQISPDSWRTRDVFDSFWRFYWHDRDGAALELPTQIFELQENQAYFVPAKVPFSCIAHESVGHFYIHFDCLGMSESTRRVLFSRPFVIPATLEIAREVAALIPQVRAAQGAGDWSHALACRLKSLIYGALANYLENVSGEEMQHALELEAAYQPLLPALEWIENHLGEKITIEILAGQCHFSGDYFARRFRQSLGQSPMAFVQERRVAWAAQQLLFSSATIDEIAQRGGFGNRAYFSRVFARITSRAPATYRASSRP